MAEDLYNQIVEIINLNLKECITKERVKFIPRNSLLTYGIDIKGYYIEISYCYMDSFYTIKIEDRKYNTIRNTIFLTKSKAFKKDMKKLIKLSKKKHKFFENHVEIFTIMIKEEFEKNNGLDDFETRYLPDLKFDGLFL